MLTGIKNKIKDGLAWVKRKGRNILLWLGIIGVVSAASIGISYLLEQEEQGGGGGENPNSIQIKGGNLEIKGGTLNIK